MVSSHIFYQFVLLGLLWLCIMLHLAWPSDRQAEVQTTPQPAPPSAVGIGWSTVWTGPAIVGVRASRSNFAMCIPFTSGTSGRGHCRRCREPDADGSPRAIWGTAPRTLAGGVGWIRTISLEGTGHCASAPLCSCEGPRTKRGTERVRALPLSYRPA